MLAISFFVLISFAISVKKSVKFVLKPTKKEFLDKFYASLDPFESAILNPTTDPKYTVDFSVLKYDAESGVRRSIDTFTFPTSYGEYNLGNVNNDFEAYVANLLEIAEFYDTKFCDNMYRMMTHESIKNSAVLMSFLEYNR